MIGVVVPAHNEAAQIAQTVQSLCAVDYPADKFAVWVVADNCTDNTAEVAQQHGAVVLTRHSQTERGKGYALNFAFSRVLSEGAGDAVVVVDADSVVSKNLLVAFAARIDAGALAAQADYGVRNPEASWRTRLMVLALAMFHRLRSLGREHLGVSCGLRGNGMCFTAACLHRFPHEAVGLVEDVEYGIALGRGGVRVVYVDEAQVLGEMVSRGDASASQRERWEGGRRQLVREVLWPLMGEALRARSGLLFDLACDLAVFPLGQLGVWLLLGTLLEAGRLGLSLQVAPTTYAYAAGWLCLAAYVARGMVLSEMGFRSVTTLLGAPAYVAWKLALRFAPGRKESGWVRTAREADKAPTDRT